VDRTRASRAPHGKRGDIGPGGMGSGILEPVGLLQRL
jgi:hypothetical protein